MVHLGEHRAQVYLVSLQSLMIIAGCLIVTALMKVLDDGILHANGWGRVLLAVRSAGILLLLLPALWAWLTVRAERSETARWSRVWTLASGIALVLGLAWFFLVCTNWALNPPMGPLRSL